MPRLILAKHKELATELTKQDSSNLHRISIQELNKQNRIGALFRVRKVHKKLLSESFDLDNEMELKLEKEINKSPRILAKQLFN